MPKHPSDLLVYEEAPKEAGHVQPPPPSKPVEQTSAEALVPVFTNDHIRVLENLVSLIDKGIPEVRNEEVFKNILVAAIQRGEVRAVMIAKQFGVSNGTVSRWLAGRTSPSPIARPAIVQWVRDEVAAAADRARKAAGR